MSNRRLMDLLTPAEQTKLSLDLNAPVTRVTSDSRDVEPGTVFVAVRGVSQDGHKFLAQAAAQGAVLLVGETESPEGIPAPHTPAEHQEPAVAYMRVQNSKQALARMASAFHSHPSRSMKLVGVTGTSGKTTTTYLIESILKAAGHDVGVIGTVSFRYTVKGKETVLPSTHTTPGSTELQKLLAEMHAAGCTAVVMEVSSHALKQARAAHLAFDGMVFTNLSPEHLDFHPDMEDYYRSKRILFTDLAKHSREEGKEPVLAINADDEYGRRLLREVAGVGFGLEQEDATVDGSQLRVDLAGVHGRVHAVEVECSLIGRFNASNILGAIAVASGMGIPADAISRGIRALPGVPGRVERVPNAHGIHVLVDYAHKPDALEKVLRTLRDVAGKNRIITVFGCGGDRDRTKRPVMGGTAVEHSQLTVITSDNPRTEDPLAIIAEVERGAAACARPRGPFEIEPDRRRAIFRAIAEARAGDLVLIAGKGHEDYQIIADPAAPGGTRKIHFDDREVAAEALGSR